MAAIAGILGKHGISIRAVIQRGRQAGTEVDIVFRLHESNEAAVNKAVAQIDALPATTLPSVKIRVLIDDRE
jgi:homoserine dehydrogenase